MISVSCSFLENFKQKRIKRKAETKKLLPVVLKITVIPPTLVLLLQSSDVKLGAK
jgi:hypothetical protein